MANEDLQILFKRVFGYALQPLTPPEVLERLKRGPQDIVCVLQWHELMPQHQLVLQKLTADERVVFYNPYRERSDLVAGTMLADPERRVEGNGQESVSFDTFRTFFTQRQAQCYSTDKPKP